MKQHRATRSVSSHRRNVVASVIAVGVVLAGCGGQSDSTSQPERKLVATSPAATGDVESVTWNLSTGEPTTIDPPNAASFSGGAIASNLCDPLLKIDADWKLEPHLADFEQVSPLQVVYTLRADATFWDGSPVTAEDVAYSLNRTREPTTIASYMFVNVKSVTVTGPREVTVDMTQPDALFNKSMATISGMVMKQTATEDAGDTVGAPGGSLMCSGPFKLDQWAAGDKISLSKNDDYWDADRVARADKVDFTFISDSTAITQALKAGEIDGAYEIPASAIPSLEDADAGKLFYGRSTQAVAINIANPDGVLQDVKLREALQTMIDREALAKVVYNGAAEPSYTVIGKNTWERGATSIYEKAYPKYVDARTADIGIAKKNVEASAYDGEALVMAILAGDDTQARLGQLIQEQAKKAGVTIELQSLQPLAFEQIQTDPSKRQDIDLILRASFDGVQDPLEPMSFIYLPDTPYNYTGFDDPVVTDLITRARLSMDVEERAELFVQAQEIYEKQSALIPLLSVDEVSFVKNGLSGHVASFAYWSMPGLTGLGSVK